MTRGLHRWHRRIGLVAVVWLVLVASTGILLNHSADLGLAERQSGLAELPWVTGVDEASTGYLVDGRWIVGSTDGIVYGDRWVVGEGASLRGALAVGELVAIAVDDAVWWLDPAGDVVDRIEVPAGAIVRLGLSNGRLVVETVDRERYRIDIDGLAWERHDAAEPVWSVARPVGDGWRRPDRAGAGVDLERLVLAIHSGRIIHPEWGPWLLDLVAVAMLLLGGSGLWIWRGRRRRSRRDVPGPAPSRTAPARRKKGTIS